MDRVKLKLRALPCLHSTRLILRLILSSPLRLSRTSANVTLASMGFLGLSATGEV